MPETPSDNSRIKVYEAHIDSIQKSIEADVNKQTAAKIDLLTDYITISKKAASGQQISSDDFNAAAERYNTKAANLLSKYEDYISLAYGI